MQYLQTVVLFLVLGFAVYVETVSANRFRRNVSAAQDACNQGTLLALKKNISDHVQLADINATAHAAAILVHSNACDGVDADLASALNDAVTAHVLALKDLTNIVSAALATTADAFAAGKLTIRDAIHGPADSALVISFQAACDAAAISHFVACAIAVISTNAACGVLVASS